MGLMWMPTHAFQKNRFWHEMRRQTSKVEHSPLNGLTREAVLQRFGQPSIMDVTQKMHSGWGFFVEADEMWGYFDDSLGDNRPRNAETPMYVLFLQGKCVGASFEKPVSPP